MPAAFTLRLTDDYQRIVWDQRTAFRALLEVCHGSTPLQMYYDASSAVMIRDLRIHQKVGS